MKRWTFLQASALTRQADVRAGTIGDAAGSDVVVLAVAAAPPSLDPTTIRSFGARDNAMLLRDLVPQLAAVASEAVILVLTNPLDAMTTLAIQLASLPPGRVLGAGTLSDTMRLRALLAQRCGVHPHDLRPYVLGEHGETQFPALNSASVGGAPLELTSSDLTDITLKTREVGHEIFRLKGHTNAGVAVVAAAIIEAIGTDSRAVLPVSTPANGFAGVLHNICLSLPAVIGRGGVIRTLSIQLSTEEAAAFRHSAAAVQSMMMLIAWRHATYAHFQI